MQINAYIECSYIQQKFDPKWMSNCHFKSKMDELTLIFLEYFISERGVGNLAFVLDSGVGITAMGLSQTAAIALINSEQRTAIAARNIANAQTPGYKREIAFDELVAPQLPSGASSISLPATSSHVDVAQALLVDSGAPLDLAIEGAGFVLVRGGEEFHLSRGGRFMRDAEGYVVDAQGRVLQIAGGGDLRLDDEAAEIVEDGAVLVEGVPVATIALHSFAPAAAPDPNSLLDMATLEKLELVDHGPGKIRQGMLERSNVVLSDEIVGLMRNQRLAESGAQLIRAYDQLVGQAISTFSRSR